MINPPIWVNRKYLILYTFGIMYDLLNAFLSIFSSRILWLVENLIKLRLVNICHAFFFKKPSTDGFLY